RPRYRRERAIEVVEHEEHREPWTLEQAPQPAGPLGAVPGRRLVARREDLHCVAPRRRAEGIEQRRPAVVAAQEHGDVLGEAIRDARREARLPVTGAAEEEHAGPRRLAHLA